MATFNAKVVRVVSSEFAKVHKELLDGKLEVEPVQLEGLRGTPEEPVMLTAVVSFEELQTQKIHDFVITSYDARSLISHLLGFVASLGDEVAQKAIMVINEEIESRGEDD